jgi:hypothetical protein
MNVKLSNYLNVNFLLKISAHSLYDNNCISMVIFSSQFHFSINPSTDQFLVSFVKLMCGLQGFCFPPQFFDIKELAREINQNYTR